MVKVVDVDLVCVCVCVCVVSVCVCMDRDHVDCLSFVAAGTLLLFPESETKVKDGRNEWSDKTTAPKNNIEIEFLLINFLLGWNFAFLQGQHHTAPGTTTTTV